MNLVFGEFFCQTFGENTFSENAPNATQIQQFLDLHIFPVLMFCILLLKTVLVYVYVSFSRVGGLALPKPPLATLGASPPTRPEGHRHAGEICRSGETFERLLLNPNITMWVLTIS